MKKWNAPVIEELEISDTANGGMPSRNFDEKWFDENDALHVNFAS